MAEAVAAPVPSSPNALNSSDPGLKVAAPVPGEPQINQLFRTVMAHKGSDLHLKAGLPGMMRLRGVIQKMNTPPLEQDTLEKLIYPILRDKDKKDFKVTITELPKDLAKASKEGPETSKGDHALAGLTVEDNKDRSGKSRHRGGVVVTDVEPDSAAERAGVRPGDVIMEINRKTVRTVSDFDKLTGQLSAKTPVLLLINRGNATIFLSIAP